MAHRAIVTCFVLLFIATRAAEACKILPEDICQASGAGVHCHPCAQHAYVVCSENGLLSVPSCPDGELWDPFAARCTAETANITQCSPPESLSHLLIGHARGLTGTSQQQHPLYDNSSSVQSWTNWAVTGLSSIVNAAKQRFTAVTSAMFPQQQEIRTRYLATITRPSLRMEMLYSSTMPTAEQIHNMHDALAHAASKQHEAIMLLQDAELAEATAEQHMQAATNILLSSAANSPSTHSSSSSSSDYGFLQVEQLVQNAEDAHEAAVMMQKAAEQLLQSADAEAAGVALATSAVTQQGSSSSSSSSLYGPSVLGLILGTVSAQQSTGSDPYVEDEYYFTDSDGITDDEYNGFDSYTYSDSDRFTSYYEDDDVIMLFSDDDQLSRRQPWGSVFDSRFDAVGMSDDAVDVNLIKPLTGASWASSLTQIRSDLKSADSTSDDLSTSSESEYYACNVADNASDQIKHSTSVLMAASLQDQLMTLAAQAAAAATSQQQHDGVAAAALQLGPMPLQMTITRETEMLQLARFLDSLEARLSNSAKSQLRDLDLTDPEILNANMIDGFPVVRIGVQLLGLLSVEDASRLRAIVAAQMAEIFADFVTLRQADIGSSMEFSDADSSDTTSSSSSTDNALALDESDSSSDMMSQHNAAMQKVEQQGQQAEQQQQQHGYRAAGLALPGGTNTVAAAAAS